MALYNKGRVGWGNQKQASRIAMIWLEPERLVKSAQTLKIRTASLASGYPKILEPIHFLPSTVELWTPVKLLTPGCLMIHLQENGLPKIPSSMSSTNNLLFF